MKRVAYIFICVIATQSSFGQSDSLINVLEQTEGKERIEVLHQIVIDLWLNYPARAMEFGEEALERSKNLGDSTLVSISLRLIAGVYCYKGDYEQSFEYNNRAFDLAVVLKDSSLINNGYNNIGLLYYNLGNYQTALEYLLRARLIKESIGETYAMATTLNNIGLIYDRLEEFEEARKYFEEAYSVASGTKGDDDQLYATNNIGITHLKEGNLGAALDYFKRGLALSKEIKNINWGSVSLRGIGEVMLEKDNLDSAFLLFSKSLYDSKIIDDKKGISEAYSLLAKYALKKGNTTEAVRYLDLSNKKAKQLQLRQQRLENLKLYSEIYGVASNSKLEIKYLHQYVNLRDSLFQDVVTRNLSLIPLKLQEEADRAKLVRQQAEIKSHRITGQLFTIIIIIALLLLVMMIVLLRKINIKNRKLQTNNEELHQTQKLLITSEKMASLGVLAAGIGHEINNPLNFIKNGIVTLSNKISEDKNINDEELKPYFKIINEGVDRTTNIVKSLSHFSRKAPGANEICNINEIIENCLLILHNKIRHRIQVITNFTIQGANLKGNEGRLHQAVMNIIANAEQAIKEEGTVKITTVRKRDVMEIWVEDDGVGIPEGNLLKISDPFFTTKAPGEGTGLGLFITFSIVEEHNGHIKVKSNPNKGTKFIIMLPL